MTWREKLLEGVAIPAHPLALTADRKLDERRQRGLTRYYLAAGAGGVAVGVHTTQFAIHSPEIGLYRPVLELAAEELKNSAAVRVAGIIGETRQALAEAELAASLGFHCGLVGLNAPRSGSEDQLIMHVKAVSEIIPVFGFYLQPAVGGRVLPFDFWRRFSEIERLVAIKIAPFNRYQTLDVVRAVADAGREREIALYTGNDDNIVVDLLTPYAVNGKIVRFRGGLLGHWAVWTRSAVVMLNQIQSELAQSADVALDWLTLAQEVTDVNAAFFDAANSFRGCIAGLHEVLRRQGLLAGRWCLDPDEDLSPGQSEEIERVYRVYPHLNDDAFVRERLATWMKG